MRGIGERDKNYTEVQRRAALHWGWGLGVASGTVRLSPLPSLPAPSAGDGPALRDIYQRGAPPPPTPPPVPRRGHWGMPRGRGPDVIWVAAKGLPGRPPPHSGRARPRRWRPREAVGFFVLFFLSLRGVVGEGCLCVSL